MTKIQTSERVDSDPLVTIVTPTYNRERYLNATVRSVLAQTYPNIEYIVIDDGSTDGTREICKRYRDVAYSYQTNSGQSTAINVGWTKSNGKYLMYLSSDDLLKPTAIAELVEAAEGLGSECVIYPDYDLIDQNGKHKGDMILGPFNENTFLFGLKCVLGPGVLFNKSLFDRYGGWNKRLRQTPDYDYWLRLRNSARIVNLPKVLASSRVHSGALSYSSVTIRGSLEIVRLTRKYIAPKAGDHARDVLAKAYTVSMRYQLRTRCFGSGMRFAKKIWRIGPRFVLSRPFLRGVIAELYHASQNYVTKK